MGGDAAEDRPAELRVHVGDHALHQLDVVGVNVGLAGEGVLRALLVGALAEADADALAEQALRVGGGAVEVGLENGADAAKESRSRMQALDHLHAWPR